MNEEEKNKKQKFGDKLNAFFEKTKKLNFKKFARAFAIVWMLIFIVVMTITNVGIDKTFDWIKWLGNAMILFGITVFGLFIGESIGIDKQKEKPDGLYQKNLVNYNIFRQAIDTIIIYFPLFYDWFVPQRLESKQINFLIMNDVNMTKAHNIVKYCESDDLWELKTKAIKKEVNGQEIFINKLNPHEVVPVEEVLLGRVKLELSGSSYYLQAFAESNQKDILEMGEAYKKARKYNKTSNRAIRLVGGAFISLALGILTVNDFMRANDGQAWMNLVTRITNLFTALLSGWLGGASDVKLEANAIENKTDVLKLFKSAYDKRLFEMYDENESAKMHYEEQQKEEEKVIDDIEERDTVINNDINTNKKMLELESKSNQIEMK